MRRGGRLLVVGAALLMVACGERAAPGGAAPDGTSPPPVETGTGIAPDDPFGTATPPTAPAVTDAIDAEPAVAETLPPGVTEVVDGMADAVPPPTVDPIEALREVRIDDPVPPQPDGVTDPAGAEIAIRFAFSHWLLVDLDPQLRGRIVENGEQNVDRMQASLESLRGIITGGGIAVDAVTFTAADQAIVDFHVTFNGDRSPVFPDPMTGPALLIDGTWRIASNTVCVLGFGVGADCGDAADHPAPAEALRIAATAGLVSVDGCDGVVNADSWAELSDSNGRWLRVRTEVLRGVTRLPPDLVELVLSGTRFGGDTSTPTVIGDRPGRTSVTDVVATGQQPPYVRVWQIRDDDTVVVTESWGLDLADVIAAVESLTPTDSVPACSPAMQPDVAEYGE